MSKKKVVFTEQTQQKHSFSFMAVVGASLLFAAVSPACGGKCEVEVHGMCFSDETSSDAPKAEILEQIMKFVSSHVQRWGGCAYFANEPCFNPDGWQMYFVDGDRIDISKNGLTYPGEATMYVRKLTENKCPASWAIGHEMVHQFLYDVFGDGDTAHQTVIFKQYPQTKALMMSELCHGDH